MPDIIVTTPKSEMKNAAKEAAECRMHGGGEYFRRFSPGYAPNGLQVGDRVWYVEDGYVRGYAVVSRITREKCGRTCHTTGWTYPAGVYVWMDSKSWRWVQRITMKGFQGFRYAAGYCGGRGPNLRGFAGDAGDWLAPRPEEQNA